MNIEDVFYVVHDLGVRDTIRKSQPKYSILVVSPDSSIVTVIKTKTVPDF